MTDCKKEFSLKPSKRYYLTVLLPILIGVILPAYFDKNNLSNNQMLEIIILIFFIYLIATIIGYMLGYKKIIFLYCKNHINVDFSGSCFGIRDKKYCINVDEIEQYKERQTYKGCGYMQFIMKDTSVIEIAYSPYFTTYTNLRSEILAVLSKNNIKTTRSL